MAKKKAPDEASARFEKWISGQQIDDRPQVQELFKNIQKSLPEFEKWFEEHCNGHWTYDDMIYRFYHQSFKVWYLIPVIEEAVKKLESLLPGRPLNKWFMQIISEGLKEKDFDRKFNDDWLKYARPVLEAFFHARFFLEMVIKYGKMMKKPVTLLPSGWAAILYLYDLR